MLSVLRIRTSKINQKHTKKINNDLEGCNRRLHPHKTCPWPERTEECMYSSKRTQFSTRQSNRVHPKLKFLAYSFLYCCRQVIGLLGHPIIMNWSEREVTMMMMAMGVYYVPEVRFEFGRERNQTSLLLLLLLLLILILPGLSCV